MSGIEQIVNNLIEDLTDFDINRLSNNTLVEDLDLASLDYVSIQVALKKELGINIDLNKLSEQKPTTMGDFYTFCKSFE